MSNLALPLDTNGHPLITGEADVLHWNGSYYFYFNNWGGCKGVDCCNSSGGCASCCFNPPSSRYPDPCVYTTNHSFVAYRTDDFNTWHSLGTVLAENSRPAGIAFRPHVVYNPSTNLFVMWYEDRGHRPNGYMIATSPVPEGPFTTQGEVFMAGKSKIGDFDIFVDTDGTAYHVRTGFTVEKLNASYTGSTGEIATFSSPKPSEGPAFFKTSSGTYVVLVGTGCCACKGGSTVYVFTADAPMGPFTFRGDIGSNPTPFDPHSPHNYVTNAQASAVFTVNGQYIYLGNQWVSAPGYGARNQDLLFTTKLEVDPSASTFLKQLVWHDYTIIDL